MSGLKQQTGLINNGSVAVAVSLSVTWECWTSQPV